jgi:hypothetical protein
MKKHAILIFLSYFIIACSNTSKTSILHISNKNNREIKSKLVLQGDSSRNYYDISMNGLFYVLLDYTNDTILQVYRATDQSCVYYCLRGDSEDKLQNVSLVKNEILNEKNVPAFYLLKNETNRIYKIQLDHNDRFIMSRSVLFSQYPRIALIPTSDCHITESGIYGVSVIPSQISSYYFFHPYSGYTFIKPYKNTIPVVYENPALYLSHICVNESKRRLYSASRFVNSIQYYNIETHSLKKVFSFGEKAVYPVVNNSSINVYTSIKYFIKAYNTRKYAYFLYSGSWDFSTSSSIVIFDWNGKHITTLQLDSPITSFCVTDDNRSIYAINRNNMGKTDIIQYLVNL